MSNQTTMVSTAPTPAILIAQRNQSLGWTKAFGELIDNSFDAKATSILISITNKTISILDNGVGCDDVGAMIQQGRHLGRKGGGLGRYGVGLKDAALWFWGMTSIVTADGKKIRTLHVNWDALSKKETWELASENSVEWSLADAEAAGIVGGRGTLIKFINVEKRATAKTIDSLVGELGFTFYPALLSGKQISIRFNDKPFIVPPFRVPLMQDPIDRIFQVNGKQVRLIAGIVSQDQPNDVKGHAIAYRHRVIFKTSGACGDFGSSRFLGLVELGEGWRLARNKDEISEDYDDLISELYCNSKSVLAAAHTTSESVAMEQLRSELQAEIGGMISDMKSAKRTPKKESLGTVKPSGTGKEHKRAHNRHDREGKYSPFLGASGSSLGGFLLHMANEGVDGPVGRVEERPHNIVVVLNLDHAWIGKINKDRGGTGWKATIISLLCSYVCTLGDKKLAELLPIAKDIEVRTRFIDTFSIFMRGMAKELEPKDAPIIAQQVA